MAERIIKSRESDPGDYDDDDDDDVATGIGVVINIGHKCNHLTTSNSATGSHTRNFHLMDGEQQPRGQRFPQRLDGHLWDD